MKASGIMCWGLRGQLIMAVALVHAVVMILFVWDLTQRQKDMLLDHQNAQAEALAENVATTAAGWVAARDLSGLQEIVEAQRRYPETEFVMVLDAKGQVLAHSDHSRIGQYVRGLPSEAKLTGFDRSKALVDVAAPVVMANRLVGWARVGIGQRGAGARLHQITRDGLFYALGAIVVGAVIAGFMGTRLTANIYAIRAVSKAVNAGSREARVPALGASEMGQLGVDFNEMLDGLRQREREIEGLTEKLSESEEKYRTVADFTYDWEYWQAPNGSLLYVSPACERLTGYRAEEFQQDPLLLMSITHSDHRDQVVAHMQDHGDTTAVADHQELDFRILTRSGEERWIAHVCRRVHGRDGKYLGRRASNRDITERKRMEVVLRQAHDKLEQQVAARTEKLLQVNAELLAEITERERAGAALRENEAKYRILFDRANNGISLMTGDGEILSDNEAYGRMHGYSAEEMRHMRLKDLAAPATVQLMPERMGRLQAGEALTFEVEHFHKDGHVFPLEVSASLISADGKSFIQSFYRDITERKQMEESVLNSLREKEFLLKEIHHRVKNNLQIVSSLLRLQLEQIDHPLAKAALLDMQNRVRSMALIHEHLYGSENLAQVDMAAYLRNLCPTLVRAQVSRPEAIRLQLDLGPVYLEIDQAIPCGLLVNELVCNALKHAFPEGHTGEVRVALKPLAGGRQIHLRVSDNGVGLAADFDPQRLRTLGLELVAGLASQLQGKLEIGPGPGASFEVVFTLAKRRDEARKTGDTELRRRANE